MLRHSDAVSHHDEGDHARELSPQGIESCEAVGNYLQQSTPVPAHVLCSSATRTQQTAQHSLQHAALAPTRDVIQKLYLASPDDIFLQIQAAPDHINSLLVVGHNPGIHAFCLQLYQQGNQHAFKQLQTQFPSPAIAVFDLPIESWGLIAKHSATLVDFTGF